MASHKSAKKRIRSNEKKRIMNKMTSSRIKTTVKKVMETGNREEAEKHYKELPTAYYPYAYCKSRNDRSPGRSQPQPRNVQTT